MAYLHIVVPPTILDSESTTEINVLEYKTIKATCKAEGNPPPVITWNHNGYKIGKSKYAWYLAFRMQKT